MPDRNDTIVAIATGNGGAIAVIRLSGPDAAGICDAVFRAADRRRLTDAASHTVHYGKIFDPADDRVIDDVLVSVFLTPRSYTGENSVEISCHGSHYICQQIVELLVYHGARTAEPGEFTLRAFLNGKLDLSQAEAVADLIASTDRATHTMASNQMRGGYSAGFAVMRAELLTLVSLLELELDFGEEDVAFADRARLGGLMDEISAKIERLVKSFSYGNVLRNGIAVAIAGSPNVGKSTLLNTLVNDDRAMVSDIAGTTRDVIEESIVIDGVRFRFLDTAGIRNTEDTLEKMGIERTRLSIGKADVVMLVVEAGASRDETAGNIAPMLVKLDLRPEQNLCIVVNKIDKSSAGMTSLLPSEHELAATLPSPPACGFSLIGVSAKHGTNMERLFEYLSSAASARALPASETIISNSRHYEALIRASESIERACTGLRNNLPTDLLAQDIRETLHHLGTITGEITTDEILDNIFSEFCIGK